MSAPEQSLKRINKIPRGRFFASNNVVKHIIFAAIDSMPYNDCAVLLQRHWRRATGLNGFHIAHIRRQRVSTGCKSIYITILTQAKNKFAITGITFQPNIFIGHCKKFLGHRSFGMAEDTVSRQICNAVRHACGALHTCNDYIVIYINYFVV